MARLLPLLDAFDGQTAPAREEFLARVRDPVVGKDGIEFDGTLWWSRALHRLTSVPRDSKGKRPTLELLFDAAAKSRDALTEVTLIVRDPRGVVQQRVPCIRRSEAQHTADRDEERAAQERHARELQERRTAFERRAAAELTGMGAAAAQETLATARSRQGRPGDLRRRATRAKSGASTPATPRTSGSTTAPTSRGSKSAASTKTAARTAAAPGPQASDAQTSGTGKWAAFNAFAAALGRTKGEPPA